MAAPQTIPEALRRAAETFGDRPAYIEGDRTVTYTELLDRVERTAEVFINNGACCGDRIVLWGPNSIDWAVTALAVTVAGGVLVPVNSRYVGHEVADVVRRTGAAAVVVHDGFLGRDQLAELREAGVEQTPSSTPRLLSSLRDVVAAADRCEGQAHDGSLGPDSVADILFTSGTTGRSKGAMSSHAQTLGAAAAWAELGGVRADDRYLVVNPFFHSFGYKIGIIVGLLTGATLYPVATFDVAETMRLIERERITVFPGAPTLYQSMISSPDRAGIDLSSLRLAVTGAAVVPVVLIERMRAAAPEGLDIDQVVTAFGMTEAVVVTMCREGDSAETVAGTCGRAIPGMETRIDAPQRSGDGSNEGELLVRGEFVMQGYLDDPEATAQAIDADGWLHTGDVGRLDARGNLTITDRVKDMYICGGFNVYPAEIEQALARLDGVADVAVIGVPDERMGEVGAAYVVRSPGATGEALDESAVRAFAQERLANFKVPRAVRFVEALPRNLGGKVLKTDLREQWN
ncbi:FadD3 family acyl-CoA ligase [Nocardioides acrostichi]|uniref:AMP-binding protein n=1 Tax=Nocardioides acrostichi TaxID=2784339 RepID=A0A930V2Q0_9ACTN|nr:FadD3 family acyl-CoA ligase [Nocardioides acrostichi]MBF4162094.1 AMP-binding protein [Nocardioides acrostichi]